MADLIRPKNLDDWRKQARECINDIHHHAFYEDRWERVKHTKLLEDCTKEELLKPFQDFWEALPDSASIRRQPFFAVCNLAEEYCFGEDEGEPA